MYSAVEQAVGQVIEENERLECKLEEWRSKRITAAATSMWQETQIDEVKGGQRTHSGQGA